MGSRISIPLTSSSDPGKLNDIGADCLLKCAQGTRLTAAHVFRIGLCPWEAGLDFRSMSQKRFSARSAWGDCVLSPRPTLAEDSLAGFHQDALMYSAILDPGTTGARRP